MKVQQRNFNQLYQLGSRDDLFRDLDSHLNLTVEQQIDLAFSCSFSILKINKYNRILSSFGEEAANYVIFTLVERLNEALKEDATLYRLKTEEFGIIFKHQSMDEINQFVKFIVQPIPYGHDFINIQLSLGLVDLTTQIKKHTEVLRRADIALKLAKSDALNWQYFNHQQDYLTHTDRDLSLIHI